MINIAFSETDSNWDAIEDRDLTPEEREQDHAQHDEALREWERHVADQPDAPANDAVPEVPLQLPEGVFTSKDLDGPSAVAVNAAQSLWSNLAGALDNVGKERNWFAQGAIEGSPLIMLAGPEKSHKSWTAMDLVVAAITGGKWLGKYQIMRPGPVVYFDGEYGEHEFARRIARIARGRGADPRKVVGRIRHYYSPGMRLTRTDPDLITRLRDIGQVKPALIVLDPIRNHLDGDENAAPVVLGAYTALDKLRCAGECPVLVLHHLNKSGGFTGSRAFTSRADLLIEGSDTQAPTYTTRGRTLRPKSDLIAEPFGIQVEHTNDDDDSIAGTTVTSAAPGKGSKALPEGVKADSTTARVLAFLGQHKEPRSVSYIAAATGKDGKPANKDSVKSALEELAKLGHAALVPNGVLFQGRMTDGWRVVEQSPDWEAVPRE